jgi:RNA recognition motif-containing protein
LIEYESFNEAKEALNKMNGKEINGQEINVSWAFVKGIFYCYFCVNKINDHFLFYLN